MNYNIYKSSFSASIKKVTLLALLALLLLFPFIANSRSSNISFHYQLSAIKPEQQYFSVELKITGIEQSEIDLKMPVWTPGYYWILDLPSNVFNFVVRGDNNQLVEWHKTDKNTWRIATVNNKNLTVNYQVYANAHSVAESYLDNQRAFVSPTGIFMFTDGFIDKPVTVTAQFPDDWKGTYSGLEQLSSKTHTWKAVDFDELYDCPIIAGNQKVDSFNYENRPFYLVVDESIQMDQVMMANNLKKIAQEAYSMMGDIPFKKYYYFFLGKGYGGLEHRNSMSVFSMTYPTPAETEEYNRMLSYLAHEYFHLYNVKAIRPLALGPFDYSRENYTNMLWVSEGFTVYYEYLLLYRAGFINRQQILDDLSNSINNFETRTGRQYLSATQSSFDTWLNFFRFTNVHTQNTTISYYDIGCALGLLIDLEIRFHSDNKNSLDDVMRYLYRTYYQEKKRGFTDDEFRAACELMAGKPMGEIFMYANSTVPFNYEKYLSYAGLTIKKNMDTEVNNLFGITTRQDGDSFYIADIAFDSPAWNSGLSAGDQVLEINSQLADQKIIDELLGKNSIITGFEFKINRNGKIKTIKADLIKQNRFKYELEILDNLTPKQKSILEHWLP